MQLHGLLCRPNLSLLTVQHGPREFAHAARLLRSENPNLTDVIPTHMWPGAQVVQSFHSSQVRTTENRYTGSNFPGYANPEYDALLERYLTTVPRDERFQVAGQIVHHLTDQLLAMPIYYSVTSTMAHKRLHNVRTTIPNDASIAWNVAEWDVQ